MEQFDGKVALITGASSGIGRAAALAFARNGAKVVVNADKNINGGEETVQLIKEAGGEAVFMRADISIAGDVETLIDTTVQTFGRLDFAHNNAAIGGPNVSFIECTEELWDNIMEVNLKGVWLCMKYEITYMIKHGGGAIVNSSSIAGLVGAANSLTYVTSKHGVNGLTKVAAAEYGKMGIRVNAVCPIGMEGTGMHERIMAKASEFAGKVLEWVPLGRTSKVQEVAEVVVWLCSKSASFVTALPMPVDGGFTSL